MLDTPIAELGNVEFAWPGSDKAVLKIDSLKLFAGEKMFIKGASGSGKSTLLSMVVGINTPSHGSVKVLKQELHSMSSGRRDKFRADHMGVIFQQFNLLPYLSVVENVLLPCRFSVQRKEKAAKAGGLESEAKRLLGHLDIDSELQYRRVSELSVGQQQRVAAARALIGRPELVIADEPTSSLDEDRRRNFIELLFRECEEEGTALMFVSHDAGLEPMFDRAVHLDEINGAI